MRKVWKCLIFIIFVLILVSLLLVGCSSEPSIIGYWEDIKQKNIHLEFTSDGDLIIDNGELVFTDKYEIISENYLEFDNLTLGIVYDLIGYTIKYHISGDTLKLQVGEVVKTLKRIH